MKSKVLNSSSVFDSIVMIIAIISILVCFTPFLHTVALSLSSNQAVISAKVSLIPVGFNLEAYKSVFSDNSMIKSLLFTVALTVGYTALSMLMTIFAAYPLTKERLKGKTVFLVLIIITMYFNGGMIPDYLLVKQLRLLNTQWALVFPTMISAFNLIILKSFFTSSIPPSLEESAHLDGCTDFGILVKIVLPLSTPVLATLSLFYAVGRWNGFQDALFYITNPKLYPLQLKLYQIVYNSMSLEISGQEGVASATTAETLKAASIMFATIPIIIVYPWLQRYFVNGVMIGAVKG